VRCRWGKSTQQIKLIADSVIWAYPTIRAIGHVHCQYVHKGLNLVAKGVDMVIVFTRRDTTPTPSKQ
jgi:hypothetical protein